MTGMEALMSLLADTAIQQGFKQVWGVTGRWVGNTNVQTAIAKTGAAYSGKVEGVESHLTGWLNAPGFSALIERIGAGSTISENELNEVLRNLDIDSVYMGSPEENLRTVLLIMQTFFEELRNELLRSPDGRVYQTHVLVSEMRAQRVSASPGGSVPPHQTSTMVAQPGMATTDHKKFQAVRRLLERHMPRAALAWLEEYREDMGDATTLDERYEVHALRGAAFISLREYANAEECFEAAAVLKPERANALANLANAQLLLGHVKKARDTAGAALALEADNVAAIRVSAQSAERLGETDEAKAIAGKLPNTWERAYVLGILCLNAGDWESSVRFLRAAYQERADPNAGLALVAALLDSGQHKTEEQGVPLWADVPDEFTEAERLLSHIAAELRRGDNLPLLAECLFRIVPVKAVRGDQSAVLDYEEAVKAGGQSDDALKALCGLLVESGRAATALELVEAHLEKDSGNATIKAARAILLSALGDHARAMEVARSIGPSPEGREHQDGLLRVDILLGAGELDGAEQELSALTDDVLQWDVALRVAELQQKQGKLEEAVLTLDASLQGAPKQHAWRLKATKANLLLDAERWAEAADCYEQFVTPLAQEFWVWRLLVSRFNAGDWERCLEFAALVRNRQGLVAASARMEATVLANLGHLEQAGVIYDELAKAEPENPKWQLDAAVLAARRGDGSEAVRRLPDLSTVKKLSVEDAMRMAAILLNDGQQQRALDTAFECRMHNAAKPEAHLNYVGMFHRIAKSGVVDLDPDKIGVGTYVVLEIGSERKTIEIVEESGEQIDCDRYSARSSLGTLLMGKRLGDIVSLQEHEIGRRSAKVVEVKSKYVAVFQRTMLDFNTVFPKDQRLMRLEVKEGDISPLLRSMDARSEWQAHVRDWYQAYPVPLSTVGSVLGEDDVDTWYGATQGALGRVHVIDPGRTLASVAEEMNGAGCVVPDAAVLCALKELGFLDDARNLVERWVIPQSTIDLLDMVRQKRELAPSMTVGKVGGKYVREEISKERGAAAIAFNKEVETWAKENCEILGIDSSVSRSWRRLSDAVSPHAAANVALAAAQGAVLLTDDSRLHVLAKTEGVGRTSSVPGAVVLLHQRGVLSAERFTQAYLSLVAWNYYYLPVDGTILVEAARLDDYAPGRNVANALRALCAPETTGTWAAVALSTFIRELWMTDWLSEGRRQMLLSGCLESIHARNDRRQVLGVLVQRLREILRLHPIALAEIMRRIELWVRLR